MGGSVPQKTTTLHNSYLVKVATLGGGCQDSEKNGYVVCVWPLGMISDLGFYVSISIRNQPIVNILRKDTLAT